VPPKSLLAFSEQHQRLTTHNTFNEVAIMPPRNQRRDGRHVRFQLGPPHMHPPPPPLPQPHDPRLLSSQDFQELAGPILGQSGRQIGSPTFMRRFQTVFGLPPHVVASAWSMIVVNGSLNHLGPRSFKPFHFLWALLWLKGYATEADNAARVGCCEKTFRKWSWFYVECLANLDGELVRAVIVIILFLQC
jgi:hypothetical protein